MKIDITSAQGTQIFKMISEQSEFEPETFQALFHFCDLDKRVCFIDVGSNIGIFPLALSQYKEIHKAKAHQSSSTGTDPDLVIHAHEPLPMLKGISERLMSDNDVSYHLHSTAISNSTGTADFYVSAMSDSSNSLLEGFRPSKETLEVNINTLDELYFQYLSDSAFDRVILKIDVETYEPQVLEGASRILNVYRPIIICEILANRTEQKLEPLFKHNQYNMYRYNGEHWVLESNLFGDPDYKYRDWLFLPNELLDEEFLKCESQYDSSLTFKFEVPSKRNKSEISRSLITNGKKILRRIKNLLISS
jgi:FkbM family methyltransferase